MGLVKAQVESSTPCSLQNLYAAKIFSSITVSTSPVSMASISSSSSVHTRITVSFGAPSQNRVIWKTVALPQHHQSVQGFSKLEMKPAMVFKPLIGSRRRTMPVVRAAQSNFLKVIQTVLTVGKDGIEAGTNLVPASVPRPLAKISVTVVALSLGLFVLKSFLSTAFFVLCTMGLVYFIFLAVNKGDPPSGGGGGGNGSVTSTDDSLEEARRIMEKYK